MTKEQFEFLIRQIKVKFPKIKWKLVEDPIGNPQVIGSKPDVIYTVVEHPPGELCYCAYWLTKSRQFQSDSWNIWL